jgi:hypothetical protein
VINVCLDLISTFLAPNFSASYDKRSEYNESGLKLVLRLEQNIQKDAFFLFYGSVLLGVATLWYKKLLSSLWVASGL